MSLHPTDLEGKGSRPQRSAGRFRCAGFALAALALLPPAEVSGQPPGVPPVESPSSESFLLTSPIKAKLVSLVDNWQLWDAAFQQSDREEASRAVALLLGTVSELGMHRLPDISLAILARALEPVEGGDTERANWAVEDAERLDPGRPENRFASAHLRRAEGRYLASVSDLVVGYLRVGKDPLLRVAWRENALVLSLTMLVLAGGLYLGLAIMTHGGTVLDDLATSFNRLLSAPAAYGLTFLVSIWPVFLPSGWRLLFFYWVVLLWRYLSRSASVVILAVGGLMLSVPLLMQGQQERVEIDWSAPLRAVRGLRSGQLYGGLFSDVESLQRALPDNNAVHQLTADLHLQIGQAEIARTIYQDLLAEEPRNAAAHNDLGGYFIMRRQFGEAVDHLERATALDLEIAEPYYNLYKIYLNNLGIEEAIVALEQARERAPEKVARWVEDEKPYVRLSRGSSRFDEIREALLVSQRVRRDGDSSAAPARSDGLLLLIACLATAVVLAGLVSRFEGSSTGLEGERRGSYRWLAAAIPGLPSMQSGKGFQAYAALIPIAIPLVLMRGASLGFRLPWGLVPANTIPWLLLSVSLIVIFTLKWRLTRRAASE